MQDPSQHQNAAEIASAPTQRKTESHEVHGALGRVQKVADAQQASRTLHTERMRQVINAGSEQERDRCTEILSFSEPVID